MSWDDNQPISWLDKSERIKHKHLLAVVGLWCAIGFSLGFVFFSP